MNFSYVIDTYAWIEYFRASLAGKKSAEYIEGETSATPSIVVAELSMKLRREADAGNETSEGRNRRLEFVRASSQILDLPFDIAISAGDLDVEMKRRVRGWGLVDSILLAIARDSDAKVVTGDDHFRGLKETIFVK
jgi:predicted nucleic acid-binding protein